MNILVIGAGYVGLSNALMLSTYFKVVLMDTDKKRINLLKKWKSPIKDKNIQNFLDKNRSNLEFSDNLNGDLSNFETVLIATPTNFNEVNNSFDTSSIEDTLLILKKNNFKKLVVIRSTIPIGFTSKISKEFPMMDIAYFPEFLREGEALKDCFNPSRIICGSNSVLAKGFLKSLIKCAKKKRVSSLITNPAEAESIKLFSNTFLALRIAFFNEVDTFALSKNLNTRKIIDGICMDERIGNKYNNPSFGYGGYCLPKDTKQLNANFENIPQSLIEASINSNKERIKFITSHILSLKPKTVGIYRLSMKKGSDNWRESSILKVMNLLIQSKIKIFIYEPNLNEAKFNDARVLKDMNDFIKKSSLIIANRIDKNIIKFQDKILSRDIYNTN
jgi:UDPglucose 6-dehydrogenase